MRLQICSNFFKWVQDNFSGGVTGGMNTGNEPLSVRRCANIKSRKTPDAKCTLNATYGEFCSRHWKHPRRFIAGAGAAAAAAAQREVPYTRREHSSARKIQRVWRRIRPFLRLFQQGAGAFNRKPSCNETELYTLDPIAMIPDLYYISFVGPSRNLWSFDIRSLGQLLIRGELKQNPYTREPLGDSVFKKICSRVTWLRERKYNILFPQGADLTPEQVWKQKVLDLFLRIESCGFHVSCEWFHAMTLQDHEKFYKVLYNLWNFHIGLTNVEREAIVPGYATSKPLFRYRPEQVNGRHNIGWWERCTIGLIEALLTRSPNVEQQRLGAMYCLMGFVCVSHDAAESFPWLVETMQ
jgi:hypothetical protein